MKCPRRPPYRTTHPIVTKKPFVKEIPPPPQHSPLIVFTYWYQWYDTQTP